MNVWSKYCKSISIVAPFKTARPSEIEDKYNFTNINFHEIPETNILSLKNLFFTLVQLPLICFKIYRVMLVSDHIHLRCPGNIGLLGCLIQIFFPNKLKTAKYAGNWDRNSKQPWSYKLQRYILNNTFLTRNMTVLVYGRWPDQSSNIKPFFTASYSEKQIIETPKPDVDKIINLIFAGTLTKGKRPLIAIKVLQELTNKGYKAQLVICGDGIEFKYLSDYVTQNKLTDYVHFLGNVDAEKIKIEMIKSHFLIFGSESEGWPKVVAEAMWWGCIPVTTAVSCVPDMLANGARGVLSVPNSTIMTNEIISLLYNRDRYQMMISEAQKWSRQFTLEEFDDQIKQILFR
jgi:glycosyltransferase involved in cell wall biosynthesis